MYVDHAINFALHGEVVQLGTFISILLDNSVVTVAMYGCGTANHSSRTPAGNVLLYLQLFVLVGLTNVTLLKLPTCSMHVLQTTFYLHQRQYLEPSMQALPSISVEPQAAAIFVSM